ncbi:MAG TPA: ABC transporter ATP-binding protein [Ilumatobacteraceae bacterium]
MSLQATIELRFGPLDLDLELTVEPGEVVALLGPNGAGKSTVLRALAGLVALDRGRIVIDGTVLDDPASGTFVPPEQRPIGVVFQDYLLFAHLDATENVAFGLRARGMAKAEARRRAAAWLERVGLADAARQRPAQLSGGQAQRVALARALATEPRLLLLDEPLAALDAGTRGDVRRDLRRHLASFDGMRLLVTHDPVDAYALADRVVVLETGTVVQSGTIAEVTAHPRSRYVADLVGINLLSGRLVDHVLTTTEGATVVVGGDQADGLAFAAVRPQAISLHLAHPEGSQRNMWACTVADVDQRADRVRVMLSGPVALVAEITPGALDALALQPGDPVWAAVKASEITTYPA